jgi:hypothetical protein
MFNYVAPSSYQSKALKVINIASSKDDNEKNDNSFIVIDPQA